MYSQFGWFNPPLMQMVIFTPDMKMEIFNDGVIVDPTLNVNIALDEIFT